MIGLDIALDERVVLITGAAGGIGRALAAGIIAHGGRVCATARKNHFDELSDLARAYGATRFFPAVLDVTDPAACASVVAEARAHFGGIDVLINSAGTALLGMHGTLSRNPKFFELSIAAWDTFVRTEISGPFYMAHAAVPHMLKQAWGRIINITGRLSFMVKPRSSPYGVTKFALEAATAIWAADLAGSGVTVNSVSPGGLVDTTLLPASDAADRSRLLSPKVMIPPVVWLCSNQSTEMSGMRLTAKGWNAALPPDHAANQVARRAAAQDDGI